MAETSRLNLTLASFRGHRPQRLDRALYRLAPLRLQAVVLRGKIAELLPLLRLQVLPDFSPPQDLLLACRRQAVEVLQALLILLLTLGRQMPELGIVLQSPPLLVKRLIAVLI